MKQELNIELLKMTNADGTPLAERFTEKITEALAECLSDESFYLLDMADRLASGVMKDFSELDLNDYMTAPEA